MHIYATIELRMHIISPLVDVAKCTYQIFTYFFFFIFSHNFSMVLVFFALSPYCTVWCALAFDFLVKKVRFMPYFSVDFFCVVLCLVIFSLWFGVVCCKDTSTVCYDVGFFFLRLFAWIHCKVAVSWIFFLLSFVHFFDFFFGREG